MSDKFCEEHNATNKSITKIETDIKWIKGISLVIVTLLIFPMLINLLKLGFNSYVKSAFASEVSLGNQNKRK